MIGTCKLCRNRGVALIDSHVICKFIYKKARSNDPQDKNKNPTILRNQRGSQTSQQVKQYMLCRPCEDRIGRWETYVSQLCGGGGVDSPLPAKIRVNGQKVIAGTATEATCEVIQSQPVDFDHEIVTRFAVSVIWRTAQLTRDDVERISLGRYDDEFRAYLLGTAPFPKHAALALWVSDNVTLLDKIRSDIFCFPETYDRSPCYVYSFFVFQMAFDLHVGRGIPNQMRQNCLQRHATTCLIPAEAHPFSRYHLARVYSYAMQGRPGAFEVTKESRQLIESMRPNAPGRRYGPWPAGSVGFAVHRDGSIQHFATSGGFVEP